MSFEDIFGDEEMSIDRIRNKLIEASNAYYNDSISIMSDEDFDNLKDELRRISPNDSFFTRVGAEVNESSAWVKAKHNIPMGSLNKVNTKEEFADWHRQVSGREYLIAIKADGISIDLEYCDNGDLVAAITRGDGFIGEDILENVKKMKNVRLHIPEFDGSLRGEIVIHKDDFIAMNAEAEKNGDRIYKNPRNAASGVARNFDGKYAKYCTILYFDCSSGFWDTEETKLADIETSLKLNTVWNQTGKFEDIISIFEDWEKIQRERCLFEIDGMVVVVNDIEHQHKLGMAYGNLKGKVAWKFGAIKKETILEGMTWEVGLNRRITPVGQFKPTPMGGITVENASIHNVDIFSKLNLGPGDKVIVSRRNDVIPYLEEVVEHVGKKKFAIPNKCPSCDLETEIEGKFLICPNDACPALFMGNLQKWINTLEIMNISFGTIEKLYSNGRISEPADLYRLTVHDFVGIDGLGERSGNKIVNQIQAKREIDLATFIGGLNINGFSSKICAKVMKSGVSDLAGLMAIDEKTLCKIPGIKDKIARRIVKGIKAKHSVIANLLAAGVKIVSSAKALNVDMKSDKLNGMSFVFTGAVQKMNPKGERYTREDLQRMVIENGGENHDNVKKGTTYLVQADPSSSSTKTKKAIALGTKILGENEFFKLIEG